ncbi:MAG: HpcH/HpaI aldolase/citrate lyase family protein [Candidatus Omnitrophica bacterium]|jgi:hypothetical protein|nr:HpcH/HpaI aldolase/citrate lyase family protein [Candidatus Omnitrophota bacterium]
MNKMNNLIKQLEQLSNRYNIIGIKQSFEDEGVLLNDVITMRRITELCGLELFVKIGGCEAKSDINNCVQLGVDNIIAPMVETPFALKKFIDYAKQFNTTKLYFVCESKTTVLNLSNIIDSESVDYLTGIIIGRSDLTKSLGLSKSTVDGNIINAIVTSTLLKLKNTNLQVTLGGNISSKSIDFIKELYNLNYLHNIETRNVVIKLNKHNVECLDEVLQQVLNFEIDWLKYKSQVGERNQKELSERIELLKQRS